MARYRFNALSAVGLLFLLLTLWMVWIAARNGLAYLRMRTVAVSVADSKLRISKGEGDTLEYTLGLALVATGDGDRQILEEVDLEHAVYPEEAFDELAFWAPGTRHTISFLRGQAREVRLPGNGDSPELNAAAGATIAAGLFLLVAVAMLAGLAEEQSWVRRFAWGRSIGVWTVFLFFGLAPLFGSIAFGWAYWQRANTWLPVTAHLLDAKHRFDAAALPPRVEITPDAAQLLTGHPYALLEFSLGNRTLHGGRGGYHQHGVLDSLREPADTAAGYPFRINPRNRWEVSGDPLWGEQFWAPFGILLLFGVAFTGASVLVRRSEHRFF